MKAKALERESARKMRSAGATTHNIAKTLRVSLGSVWNWVHDIELTREQREPIEQKARLRAARGRLNATKVHQNNKLKRITKAKNEADTEWPVLKLSPDFLFGLGLYVGEGTKSGVNIEVTNTDVRVLAKSLDFFLSLGVKREAIKVRIALHEGNDVAVAEQFWLNSLGLGREQLGKTTIKSNKGTSSKHPHGIGHVYLHDSHIRRKIDRWSELALSVGRVGLEPTTVGV